MRYTVCLIGCFSLRLLWNRAASEESIRSREAYVTLIHALESLGSTAQFVALLGFSSDKIKRQVLNPKKNEEYQVSEVLTDITLLESSGFIIVHLPRLLKSKSGGQKISFAEMALLKLLPWSFIDFDRIQFFDGDVMPTQNMDCFFRLSMNTFNTGNASPLNSGWYVALPNKRDYLAMNKLALKRLNQPWNETTGWGLEIPQGLYFRGGFKQVEAWNFNGASLDQGLLTHYFVLKKGGVLLLDTKEGRVYTGDYQHTSNSVESFLEDCNGVNPTKYFAHFTGTKKPWLQNVSKNQGSAASRDKALALWAQHLDSLGLPINSTNIQHLGFKSPLGYWHPNK